MRAKFHGAIGLLWRRSRPRHAVQVSLFLLVCLLLATRASVEEPPTAANETLTAGDDALGASAVGDPELSFLVVGDWGAPRERPPLLETQRLVARALELVHLGPLRGRARFVLSLGDAFYMNGIASASDPRLEEVFARTFREAPSLARLPWHSVIGNHDARGNVSALLEAGRRSLAQGKRRAAAPRAARAAADAFWLPSRFWAWRAALGRNTPRPVAEALSLGAGAGARADGGGVHLALLDTCSLICAPGLDAHEGAPPLLADVREALRTEPRSAARARVLEAGALAWPVAATALGFRGSVGRQEECGRLQDASKPPPHAQLAWLDKTLGRAQAARDWSLVAGHSPIRSVGTGHGDYPQLLATLAPRLRAAGAQVYFSGDEHSLQHLEEEGGLHLFVLGAGGGLDLHPLQPGAQPSARVRTRWARAALGFASVRASRETLEVRIYTVERSDGGGSNGAAVPIGLVADQEGRAYAVRAAHVLKLVRAANGSVMEAK